jgi:hypothetical protein
MMSFLRVDIFGKSRAHLVIAIAHGDLIFIEAEREKQEGAMIGHHGGATDIESYVPLLRAVTS